MIASAAIARSRQARRAIHTRRSPNSIALCGGRTAVTTSRTSVAVQAIRTTANQIGMAVVAASARAAVMELCSGRAALYVDSPLNCHQIAAGDS